MLPKYYNKNVAIKSIFFLFFIMIYIILAVFCAKETKTLVIFRFLMSQKRVFETFII